MLEAEYLYQLPLDMLIHIANMDKDTYIQMYIYNIGFRPYAKNHVNDFIDNFVATRESCGIIYRLFNVSYYKFDDGEKRWYMDGLYHKLDGPAVSYGEKQEYFIHGIRHRLDGPAIYYPGRHIAYYVNGKLHKLDAPALIYPGNYESYYVNGLLHRLDGPAIIYENGDEEYWQYGVCMRVG
jgi:hypothetical protein